MTDKLAHDIEGFLSELSEEAWAYYFPGTDKRISTAEDGAFLRPEEKFQGYKCQMPSHDGMFDLSEQEPFEDVLPDGDVYEYIPRRRYSVPKKRMERLGTGGLFSFIIPKQEVQETEPPVADLELDERAKAFMKEFNALMSKHEVTVEEVEIILKRLVKLSRLRITSKNEILLEDFDKKEVKMDTLTKAVFLLYLNHPEGIRYKELSDHQQELEQIYSSITGRDDLDSIRKSVADLCDPLNNSINEKVSRVKKAFRDVVNDHVARFYYIDGEKGTAKRIALSRSYVIYG